MKKIFLLLFWLVIVQYGYSQSPGYIGKRFVFSADWQMNIPFFGVAANNYSVLGFHYGAKSGTGNLNNKFGLGFTYAFASNLALRVSASNLKTGMVEKYYTEDANSNTNTINCFHKINTNNYAAFLQYYILKKGAIAPYGTYTALGYNFNSYTSKVIDHDVIFENSTFRDYQLPYLDQTFKSSSFAMEFGTSGIIKDKFIFNYAFLMSLYTLPTQFSTLNNNQFTYLRAISARTRGQNIVFLKLGFGFLF